MKVASGIIGMSMTFFSVIPVAADPTEVLDSAYTIFTANGNGAGFVTADGYVVTAQHVTNGSATVKIVASLPSTETVVGDVILEDIQRDVAVIEPHRKLLGTPLEIAPHPPKVGAIVYAIGSPIQSTVLSRGEVKVPLDKEGYLEAKIAIDHGNSGGPLFDENEQIVGMIDAMRVDGSNTALAVPASEIAIVLEDAKDNQSNAIIPVHIPKSIIGKATFYGIGSLLVLATFYLLTNFRRKVSRNSSDTWVSNKAITISIENEE